MLLDTSGLLAYHHRDEAEHATAQALFKSRRNSVIHNYVLAEFVALSHARKLPRNEALEFVSALVGHVRVELVWVDRMLHDAALTLLQARLDKGYSLCDAVSFVVMKERSIADALSTDHHFEQEGFVPLLQMKSAKGQTT